MVTRTAVTRPNRASTAVRDRAGRGLHQPVAPGAERLARDVDHLVVADRVGELVGARGFRQVDVEHKIELEGLADLGLVRHDAVIGVQREPADENLVAHRAAPADGGCDPQRLNRFGHVVRADDGSAVFDREDVRGQRSGQPPVGLGWQHSIDEALARGANQDRHAEALEGVEPGDGLHALLRRLAEADAGIEHDASREMPADRGDVERAGEESLDVGDDVDIWVRLR